MRIFLSHIFLSQNGDTDNIIPPGLAFCDYWWRPFFSRRKKKAIVTDPFFQPLPRQKFLLYWNLIIHDKLCRPFIKSHHKNLIFLHISTFQLQFADDGKQNNAINIADDQYLDIPNPNIKLKSSDQITSTFVCTINHRKTTNHNNKKEHKIAVLCVRLHISTQTALFNPPHKILSYNFQIPHIFLYFCLLN